MNNQIEGMIDGVVEFLQDQFEGGVDEKGYPVYKDEDGVLLNEADMREVVHEEINESEILEEIASYILSKL